MKQLKVKFLRLEEGRGIEIWYTKSIKGHITYLGRSLDHYTWMYLTYIPNVICEPSDDVDPSIEIVICDENWREIGRDGNDHQKYTCAYLTLKETFRTALNNIDPKIRDNIRTDSFQEWINAQRGLNIPLGDQINWAYTYVDEIDIEDIYSFKWLGGKYKIAKRKMKHQKTKSQWYEYGIYNQNDKKLTNMLYHVGWEIIHVNKIIK